MSKYFVVNNRFLACGINYMTGQQFKHFYGKNGEDIFSFPRNDSIINAYNIMNNYRYNI